MRRRSLQGLRILNTRPRKQAPHLSQEIHEAGGIALELPALAIRATSSNWIHSLPDLKKIDHALFISPNAVHYCFTQLKQHHIPWPCSIKVSAIGHASAAALHQFNITVSAIPEVPDSEHLLAIKSVHHAKNQNVLLFKGKGGRTLIEEHLIKQGAALEVFEIYQRIMPKRNTQFIQSIWHNDLVDIILLTSEQSLHQLFKLFEKEAHDWLKSKTWLVISKRLAETASALRIERIRISPPDKLINTLLDYVNKD